MAGARTAYALPYYWAKMQVACDERHAEYRSVRRQRPPAASDIAVEIGEPIAQPTELEVFLTARFRLYAQRANRLLSADIEHPPWPLQRARVTRLEETLTKAAGLPPMPGEPLAHFSSRVDLLVGLIQPV